MPEFGLISCLVPIFVPSGGDIVFSHDYSGGGSVVALPECSNRDDYACSVLKLPVAAGNPTGSSLHAEVLGILSSGRLGYGELRYRRS